MWSTLQIIFGVLGILLAFGGDRLSMPAHTNLGVACFGLASIAIGWEAILTCYFRLGSRRRGGACSSSLPLPRSIKWAEGFWKRCTG